MLSEDRLLGCLFKSESHHRSLAVRVRDLLDVPVVRPMIACPKFNICEKCKRLVKAGDELIEFRKKARDSYTLCCTRPPLKCTKETSDIFGASRDTQRTWPLSKKLTANRLNFGQGSCCKFYIIKSS